MLRTMLPRIVPIVGCVLISICSQQVSAQGLAKPARTDFLEVEPVFQLITVKKSNGADQLIRYSRRTGVTSYLKKNRWRLIKENDRRVRNSLYQVSATADATGGWNLYRLDVLNGDSWSVSSLVWNPIEEDGVKEPAPAKRYK